MHHGTEDAHTGRHHQEAQRQGWLTSPAVHQTDGDKSRQHVGQTHDDGPPHLLGGVGITRQLKDFGRVVHDDVHPRELLHHLQQYAEENGATEVAVLFKQRPAGLFDLQAFADLFQLVFRLCAGIAQAHQHAFGIVEATFCSKPARAVRQEEDANQQQNRRDDDHAEHPAPCAAVAKRGIGKICTENTDGDHQLVHRNHTAADFLRRDFRQVERGGIGRHAHGQTEQHAGNQQDLNVRCSSGEE